MVNRNKITNFSITFSQSKDMGKEEFTKSFPPYKRAICAQELHEDGGNHLHLGLILKHGINKTAMLKWIKTKYPNDFKRIDVEGTRNLAWWDDYCKKEDANVYTDGNLETEEKKVPELRRSTYFFRQTLTDLVDELERGEKMKKEWGKKFYELNYNKWCPDKCLCCFNNKCYKLLEFPD